LGSELDKLAIGEIDTIAAYYPFDPIQCKTWPPTDLFSSSPRCTTDISRDMGSDFERLKESLVPPPGEVPGFPNLPLPVELKGIVAFFTS